jgi:hypothetical protein
MVIFPVRYISLPEGIPTIATIYCHVNRENDDPQQLVWRMISQRWLALIYDPGFCPNIGHKHG